MAAYYGTGVLTPGPAAAVGLRGRDTDSPGLEVAGDADALASLLAVLDRPDPSFNISPHNGCAPIVHWTTRHA